MKMHAKMACMACITQSAVQSGVQSGVQNDEQSRPAQPTFVRISPGQWTFGPFLGPFQGKMDQKQANGPWDNGPIVL